MLKMKKMAYLLTHTLYRKGLRYGVAAAVEHSRFLRQHSFRTVIDAGANKGQFSLAVRAHLPETRIVAFEPLPGPGTIFQSLFKNDERITLVSAALGPTPTETNIHISKRADSSSLLPIGPLQSRIFSGTEEVGVQRIKVVKLDDAVQANDMASPTLLKIDVQGYELELLKGAEKTLAIVDAIYAELSFLPLYEGQPLADEVIAWLAERNFAFTGIYHIAFREDGSAVQADFHFTKRQSSNGHAITKPYSRPPSAT